MLEIILVLSIGLTLIVGGISYYRQATFAQNLYEASWTISFVSLELLERTRNMADFSDVDNGFLLEQRLMPKFLQAEGTELRHPFQGTFEVGSDAPYLSFWIEMRELPESACVRMFDFNRSDIELGRDRIIRIEVNGSAWDLVAGDVPDGSACEDGDVNRARMYFQ